MPPPPGSLSPSIPPRAAARRLLARELGGEPRLLAADAGEVAAAGERLVARVTGRMARSFGTYGAVALVSRALTRARVGNPVLSTVTVTTATAARPPDEAVERSVSIVGLAASASALGAAAAVEGLTVWLAALADLLAGIIGDDLATTILEQSAAARPSGASAPDDTFTVASGDGRPDDVDPTAHARLDER